MPFRLYLASLGSLETPYDVVDEIYIFLALSNGIFNTITIQLSDFLETDIQCLKVLSIAIE